MVRIANFLHEIFTSVHRGRDGLPRTRNPGPNQLRRRARTAAGFAVGLGRSR